MLTILHTDRSIIRGVLRGHTDHFSVLVDRYGRLVHAIAYAYLRNREDAEDVVQEAFVRLYERLDTLPWKQTIGPWLAQVARTAAIDRLRKTTREAHRVQAAARTAPVVPNPAREEVRRLVVEELDQLDPADREVLVLHYFLGKKAREVAELLEIEPATAAKRLQRARDELGRRLVDLLREDLPAEADDSRTRRVMGAIALTAAPWRPSAAAAIAVSALTGASALKNMIAAVVVLAILGAGFFAGWRYLSPRLSLFFPRQINATNEYVENAQQTPVLPAVHNDGSVHDDSPRPDVPSESTPANEAGTSVSGIVLTADARPVAGAKVVIDNALNRKWWEGSHKWNPEVAEIAPLRVETTTDQDGRFRFDPIPYTLDHPYDNLAVTAESGTLYGATIFHSMPDFSEEYVDITVRPTEALGGIVTDASGALVEDARVILKDLRSTDEGRPGGLPPCWTGSDGTFLFEHVSPGEYMFGVYATGYLEFQTEWLRAGDTHVIIRLDCGNSISGRVTEAGSGAPVADEVVSALSQDHGSHATTDNKGDFAITGLKPGKYDLICGSVLPAPYVLAAPVSVVLTEDRPATNVDVKVARGATLCGQVIDEATGAPVPRATLKVHGRLPHVPEWLSSDDRPVQIVQSGGDGRFEAPGLPTGSLRLVAQAKEYVEKSLNVTAPGYGQTQTVDVRMQMMACVRGSVVDATGAAVPGASVIASYAADTAGPWPDGVVTDAAGRFMLTLPKKQEVCLQATHRGRISSASPAVGPGSNGVVLRLTGGGSIEGTVVDASGNPVGRAEVEIAPGDEAAQHLITFAYDGRQRSLERGPDITRWAASNGVFRCAQLLPGLYDIKVRVSALPWPVGATRVQVRENQTLRTRLQVDTQGFAAVEGIVTVNGRPGKELSVWAESSHVGGNSTETGDDGRYRLYPVPAGTLTVRLEVQKVRHERTVEVSAGETAAVNFDVGTVGAAVEGAVRLNGQPVAHARVTLIPVNPGPSQSQANAAADEKGLFRLDGIEEGDYRCEAVAMSGAVSRPEYALRDARDVHLTTDKTEHIDFDLSGAAIDGTVTGMASGERAHVLLFTGDADMSEISFAALAALEEKAIADLIAYDGHFQFYGLTPGDYAVAVVAVPSSGGFDVETVLKSVIAGRFAVSQIQAPAGEPINAELKLP